jgi:hypothetical protein
MGADDGNTQHIIQEICFVIYYDFLCGTYSKKQKEMLYEIEIIIHTLL